VVIGLNNKLKNWITIFKSIKNGKKGLLTYLNYLTNNNHQNHLKSGHKIINFKNDWKKIYSNICSQIEKRDTVNLLNGKGGRRASKYGQSITLNIPYEINTKDLEPIINKILFRFYKQIHKKEKLFKNNDSWKQFKNNFIFYNVHKQPQGSKTQFNFVLSEIIEDKKLDLSKKKYSYLFKTVSNEVLKEFGIDNNNYNIKKQYKQHKNTKIYKENQLDTLIEQNKDQYQDYIFLLNKLKSLDLDIDKTIHIYKNRLEKSIIEQDKTKMEKLNNQIKKRLSKLKIELEDFKPMQQSNPINRGIDLTP